MTSPSGLPKALQRLALSGLFAVLSSAAALAQADIATYQGADRMQRLIAGAKEEGTLTIYTSATVDDMAGLTAAFDKKYGIKAQVWRASSDNIIQRPATAARATPRRRGAAASTSTCSRPTASRWKRSSAKNCCRRSGRLMPVS